MPELNVKLTLRFERDNKETVERVIEGADNIAYVLEEAGLLDDEIRDFLFSAN